MEINLITKVIDKVHDGEMSKEQGFNRIEQIMINYYKELDDAIYDKDDIRREIFYLFDFEHSTDDSEVLCLTVVKFKYKLNDIEKFYS